MTDSEPRDLIDYETGETVGPATAEQLADSIEAARTDGGAGVIRLRIPHWDVYDGDSLVRFYSEPVNLPGCVTYSAATDAYVLGEEAK